MQWKLLCVRNSLAPLRIVFTSALLCFSLSLALSLSLSRSLCLVIPFPLTGRGSCSPPRWPRSFLSLHLSFYRVEKNDLRQVAGYFNLVLTVSSARPGPTYLQLCKIGKLFFPPLCILARSLASFRGIRAARHFLNNEQEDVQRATRGEDDREQGKGASLMTLRKHGRRLQS